MIPDSVSGAGAKSGYTVTHDMGCPVVLASRQLGAPLDPGPAVRPDDRSAGTTRACSPPNSKLLAGRPKRSSGEDQHIEPFGSQVAAIIDEVGIDVLHEHFPLE